MILYHGSNQIVQTPRLIVSKHSLDFGKGFYMMSDLEQAQRWAQLKTKRQGTGKATVSAFEVEQPFPNSIKVRVFSKADTAWLSFITTNRRQQPIINDYDIVIGPVADDQAMPSIRLYLDGFLTATQTLAHLRTWVLKDQYAFRTERALETLIFKEAIL